MKARTPDALRTAVLLIFLSLLAESTYSWVLFDVYKYGTSGERVLIGQIYMALSNTGCISEFQPCPRGQMIQQNQDPYLALISIPPGSYPHIHTTVCSDPATKHTLSTSISFSWPRHMSSNQYLLIGQTPRTTQCCCNYFFNNNGISYTAIQSEHIHINLWVLLETLIRNAPNQVKANFYQSNLLHAPLLLHSLARIQTTEADLQIAEITYQINPEGLPIISIGTEQNILIEIGYSSETSSPGAENKITFIKVSYNGTSILFLAVAANQMPKMVSNVTPGRNPPSHPDRKPDRDGEAGVSGFFPSYFEAH